MGWWGFGCFAGNKKKMTKKKWVTILIVGFLGIIGIMTIMVLPSIVFSIPDHHSIPLEKEIANDLLKDLEEYGKFTELDDCQRYSKSINGISIRMDSLETEKEYGRYYKEVLAEQGIKESEFEKFREKLEKTKLRHYFRTDKYSVFIVDGFLDNVWGYLYSHDKGKMNYDYFEVDAYTIRVVEDLGGNWYRFGGT